MDKNERDMLKETQWGVIPFTNSLYVSGDLDERAHPDGYLGISACSKFSGKSSCSAIIII